MKSFSKITIGLGIFIIVSASFMRQVNDFLLRTIGNEAMKLAFLLLFLLVLALYVIYVSYKRLAIYRIALSFLVFGLAYLLILWQPYFGEKIHVLEYGVLGYLALKDRFKAEKLFLNPALARKVWVKNIIYALCFIVLMGSLDEGFQWILPYRVFEVRDIMTNVTSGVLGIIQFLIYRNRMI